MQSLQQIRQTLLAGDAAHEQQGGLGTVDVVTIEHLPARIVRGRGGEVRHGDAVVDHNHLVWIKIRVGGQNVLAHATGNGDHAVGVLVSVLLGPGAQVVAATELLTLPWAERLQRVRGDNQRSAMQHLGQVAGQAGVPSVRMNNVGIHIVGNLQIHAEGLQCRIGIGKLGRRIVSDNLQTALGISGIGNRGDISLSTLAIKRTHGHVNALGQNLGQLLGVYAGTAIHMRRVFAG